MNFFPLCTAIVCPTISGTIVERRDHVFWTRFSFVWFMRAIVLIKCSSRNGPFFIDLAIVGSWFLVCGFWFWFLAQRGTRNTEPETRNYFFPLRTMNLSVRLLFRVLYPRVGCPQ